MEFVRLDRFGVAKLDHACPADHGVERHLVQALAVPDEVEGTIHVSSGVSPHRDLRYVSGVAVLYVQRPFDPDRRVVGPVNHAAMQRDRDVDPAVFRLSGVHDYLPFPSARSRLKAALMRVRCVKAWGKLPKASPLGPISSA